MTSRGPRLVTVIALVALALVAPAPHAMAADIPPCSSDPGFSMLDFWVGSWDVFENVKDGAKVGANRIQKIQDGCAVTEDWTDIQGGTGHSLFYYLPSTKTWKQVWVTPQALASGGLKEKQLVERLPDGGLRFQGTLLRKNGGSYLDRTTLTPKSADEVLQKIEISLDGGKEWKTTFDAVYRRVK